MDRERERERWEDTGTEKIVILNMLYKIEKKLAQEDNLQDKDREREKKVKRDKVREK